MADLSRDVSVDEITPGLFVGNMACVESERALQTLGITAVVSVVSNHRRPFPQSSSSRGIIRGHPLKKLYDVKDRVVIFVDDTRSDNIFRHFEGACEFISHHFHQASARNQAALGKISSSERRGVFLPREYTVKNTSRVLVHCSLGVSRSVSIVAAYMMWKWGFSASRALQHIKKKRRVAAPNEGFIDQLLVWEALRCNPWLSRRFHIRHRAYYEMTARLEYQKRVRAVSKAMEEASKENTTRGSHRTRHETTVHIMEEDTFRYCTRARH